MSAWELLLEVAYAVGLLVLAWLVLAVAREALEADSQSDDDDSHGAAR